MRPIIYQVFPRYWGPYKSQNVRNGSLEENGCGHFADFDDASLDYVKSLGCTHIWFTGVMRHATSTSNSGCKASHPSIVKGKAGSPFAISDYYDVNPYLAEDPSRRMEEFEQLVKRTHEKGLKFVIDFIPNHVSRDNVNFGQEDDKSLHWKAENDFYYYPGEKLHMPVDFQPSEEFPSPYVEFPARATGNNCFTASPSVTDWYETVKLNYCDFHTQTWDKMLDILRFWASKGVDAFRCDMVELLPSDFLEWAIAKIKKEYPGIIFIAEVYKKELYHYYIHNVGFDYLYDKSGMYDALSDILRFNINETDAKPEPWQSAHRITGTWQKLNSLQSNLLYFLENHDEQRLASDFYAHDASKTFCNVALSYLFNNAALMLYSGEEVGERGMDNEGFSARDGKSTIFDWWKSKSADLLWKYSHKIAPLDEHSEKILAKYREILSLASSGLCENGHNYDLCYCNEGSEGFDLDRHFAFLRYDNACCKLIVCNFSGKMMNAVLKVPMQECSADWSEMEVKVQVEPYSYMIKNL